MYGLHERAKRAKYRLQYPLGSGVDGGTSSRAIGRLNAIDYE